MVEHVSGAYSSLVMVEPYSLVLFLSYLLFRFHHIHNNLFVDVSLYHLFVFVLVTPYKDINFVI